MRFASVLALSASLGSLASCVAADVPRPGEPAAEARQPLTQPLLGEVEPNAASASATPLGALPAVAEGNVFPTGDVDFFSFTAAAGDRLYAATMTAGSASGSVDSTLDLLASDGSTVIETDLDDGVFGATASSIAGAVLPAAGTYYLRVTATPQVRPYRLHAMLKSGAPFDEFEPNNNLMNAQPVPLSRWISGALANTGTDNDYYTLPLSAGDTIFASLDLDPERDGDWAGQLILGQVNGPAIGANDAGGVAGPDSEALFYTVKNDGNYYLRVTAGVAGSFGTYHLAVAVTPRPPQPGCATFTSADVPKVIPAAGGKITSTISVPMNTPIGTMSVSLNLTHASMADLDVHLQSPAGNDNALFTDVGNANNPAMDLELSDSAALPISSSAVMNLGIVQPEPSYRLRWFEGEEGAGTWTLNVEDDTNDVNGGTLNGWSITICPPPAAPTCPDGAYPVTLLDTGFESGAAGFTHGGPLDEWALGTPSATVIASCSSGTQCWKTKLAGNYSANASGDLSSPALDLGPMVAPIRLRWSQKYQIDNASADHASVDVVPAMGASKRVWEHQDAAMTTPVGLAAAVLQESAGWGKVESSLDSFAGQSVQVKFHFDSDATNQYAGYAVDDVKVTACRVNVCGDGTVFGAEVCDDGNLVSGDGCDANCTVTACGNGVTSMGEACDDGNAMDGDGCDHNCTVTACGNGVMTMGEVCDDGNIVDGDGCDANCTVTACGNGIATMGEACDDGNVADGDGCDSNCTVTACGNGVMTMGEVCDDGNAVDGDGCDSNCTATACGNGVMTMGEACDDGNVVDGDGCDSNCTVTGCGNGIVTAGEACDDGNMQGGDGCDALCQKESMGQGGAGGGGGQGGSGGQAGTGGNGGNGGSGGQPGTGGSSGHGGTGGQGGSGGRGGEAGSGGEAGATSGTTTTSSTTGTTSGGSSGGGDSGGCGCVVAGGDEPLRAGWVLALGVGLASIRRRRLRVKGQ